MNREDRQYFDLIGSYHHKMDDNSRVSLPSAFRKSFPDDLKEFVITPSEDGKCLYVFDKIGFYEWVDQAFIDKFDKYDSSNPLHRSLRRRLTANASFTSLDKAGRIAVPEDKRELAGIEKDVLIIGTEGRFELWNEARYDDSDADLSLLFG